MEWYKLKDCSSFIYRAVGNYLPMTTTRMGSHCVHDLEIYLFVQSFIDLQKYIDGLSYLRFHWMWNIDILIQRHALMLLNKKSSNLKCDWYKCTLWKHFFQTSCYIKIYEINIFNYEESTRISWQICCFTWHSSAWAFTYFISLLATVTISLYLCY